jgi:hypothetical protein
MRWIRTVGKRFVHTADIQAWIKSRVISFMSWAEDHAKRLVQISVVLVLLAGAAGLLWSWAQIIGIIIGLAAILAIVVDTVRGASVVIRWLERRRGSRALPGEGAEYPDSRTGADGPSFTVQASADALPEAEPQGREDEDISGDGKSDERS